MPAVVDSPDEPIIRTEPPADLLHGEPLPMQGEWTEAQYLSISRNWFIEYVAGWLEFPPMPTEQHQRIMFRLAMLLHAFVAPRRLGEVLPGPMPMYVSEARYREPDIMFMLAAHAHRREDQRWRGADLVVEVVSRHEPQRDKITKRREYADAGIQEYWLVEPDVRRVTVLTLEAGRYNEHGVFEGEKPATSKLLAGLQVDLPALFAD